MDIKRRQIAAIAGDADLLSDWIKRGLTLDGGGVREGRRVPYTEADALRVALMAYLMDTGHRFGRAASIASDDQLGPHLTALGLAGQPGGPYLVRSHRRDGNTLTTAEKRPGTLEEVVRVMTARPHPDDADTTQEGWLIVDLGALSARALVLASQRRTDDA